MLLCFNCCCPEGIDEARNGWECVSLRHWFSAAVVWGLEMEVEKRQSWVLLYCNCCYLEDGVGKEGGALSRLDNHTLLFHTEL